MEKYTVQNYIDILKEDGEIKEIINCNDILEKVVNHVSYNSKEIVEDTMFVCKGASFKVEYLKEAINAGVFVYISEKEYEVDIPCILVNAELKHF